MLLRCALTSPIELHSIGIGYCCTILEKWYKVIFISLGTQRIDVKLRLTGLAQKIRFQGLSSIFMEREIAAENCGGLYNPIK
jgi:hypothetical protein